MKGISNRKNKQSKRDNELLELGRYVSNPKMVVYHNPLCVMPPKFVNTMKTRYTGVTAAGTALTQAFGTIYATSVWNPFSTAQPINTVAASNGMLVVANNGSNIASVPDGYSTMSAIYEYYKVLRSSIIIRCRPTNSADVLVLTCSVLARSNQQTVQVSLNGAQTQPYVRSATFQAGQNDQKGAHELKLSINSWDALGMTQRQFLDEAPSINGGVPASNILSEFTLNLFPIVAATNTGVMAYEFLLDQEVEWSEPINFA